MITRDDILRKIAARVSGPGPVKVRTPKELCEDHATEAFRVGLDVAYPDPNNRFRPFARRLGVDDKTVRDWYFGHRPVPGYALVALREHGRMATVNELMSSPIDGEETAA